MLRLLKKRPGRALWVPVLLAAVLMLLLPDPAAAQNQQVGSVSVLEGRASVIRAGTSRTEALQVGSSLYQNDTIKTEAGGKLRVLFMDQSVISVASNTSLTITEYVFNPQEQVRSGGVKLLWGKVKCFVNDFLGYKSKKFNVQTDTAVIGVRGTVFLVWKVNDEITRAAAFQNEVTVANVARPDEYVILGPGMMSQVVGRARPTYPSKVDLKIYQLLHEGFLPVDMAMITPMSTGTTGNTDGTGQPGGTTGSTTRPDGTPGTVPGGTEGTEDEITTTTTMFQPIDMETTTTSTLPLPSTTTSTTLPAAVPTEMPDFPPPPTGP